MDDPEAALPSSGREIDWRGLPTKFAAWARVVWAIVVVVLLSLNLVATRRAASGAENAAYPPPDPHVAMIADELAKQTEAVDQLKAAVCATGTRHDAGTWPTCGFRLTP